MQSVTDRQTNKQTNYTILRMLVRLSFNKRGSREPLLSLCL